jgi:hypothetical protein
MNSSEITAGIVAPASPRTRGRWFWPLAMLTLATGGASILLISQMPAALIAATVQVSEPRALRLHPVELVTVEPQRIKDLVKVTGTKQTLPHRLAGLRRLLPFGPVITSLPDSCWLK